VHRLARARALLLSSRGIASGTAAQVDENAAETPVAGLRKILIFFPSPAPEFLLVAAMRATKKPPGGGFFVYLSSVREGRLAPASLTASTATVAPLLGPRKQGCYVQTDREIAHAVTAALSPARLSTYVKAVHAVHDVDHAALALYAWNAEVSGALLVDLHVLEVVMRNAVAEALEQVYGIDWPWSPTFERSLPHPSAGYSPRQDLQVARRRASSTGNVIPELKLVFWQKLFTSRYDDRLWNAHLKSVFPHACATRAAAALRSEIYRSMEKLRLLRNRIAHHEPIFMRDLRGDREAIFALVRYRSPITAEWLAGIGRVTTVLGRPCCVHSSSRLPGHHGC